MTLAAAVSTRSELREETVPFQTEDGLTCNLLHVWSAKTPSKGPVLLVHGAGVRANIFRPPVKNDIVRFLLANGYDVWLENWRASIDLPVSRWNLDKAAVFDHPVAVKKVVAHTGASRIKALVHCQGSTSFTMSALAGLVPQVETIVSNAVSLHVVVPQLSRYKLNYAVPAVAALTPVLNPQWGREAPSWRAKALSSLVRLTHRECDNDVCKWASFTYGSGFPTLWRHENLNDATHDWLQDEFAAVPLAFFQQMARCCRRGSLLSLGEHHQLPDDFLAADVRTTARFALVTGEQNECFLPESQRLTHAFLDARRPGYHTLRVFPGYGHLDVFLGKRADSEVFPALLAELDAPVAALSAAPMINQLSS
jgi:choline dehydrogenase-like flavoprotein